MELLWLLVLVVSLCILVDRKTTAIPFKPHTFCSYEDDDCREQFMHPAMPNESPFLIVDGENSTKYWIDKGSEFVAGRVENADQLQRGIADNIILFVGDGMSLTTLAASRAYIGGEEQKLAFESFTGTGLAKTYSIDRLVPDSASTATAFLCGSKSKYGTIGVIGQVGRGDCEASKNTSLHVSSIAKWALDSGKSVGVVTTTRVTHATPAALYAHISERDWENNESVKKDCGPDSGVADIAQQLIKGDVGRLLKVVMGGGIKQFIDRNLYPGGLRTDGRNLIDEFLEESGNIFVTSKSQMNAFDTSEINRFLGLFNDDHMSYNLEEAEEEPSLSEMTEKAIDLLKSNPNGYLLFVEGGKIDMAHHKNKAKLALDETSEFNKAVDLAKRFTDEQNTLIVVTSDHSHTMSIAGYANRGSDIFGPSSQIAEDDMPYLTLSYANGPSFSTFFDTKTSSRVNPLTVINRNYDDTFPATAPMESETHGGEDVAVYASGPWSHLFTGVYEQSTLPYMMAYASCLGDGLKACITTSEEFKHN